MSLSSIAPAAVRATGRLTPLTVRVMNSIPSFIPKPLSSLYCQNQTVLKIWRTTLGVHRSGTSGSRWPSSIHLDLENPS
jgi:hypothetical protein